MRDEERVLAANARFYSAFAAKDADAMAAVWARRSPVACVHPGWQPLHGRDAVLASWRSILSGPGAPAISCGDAVAHVLGDTALVLCIERIPGVELIATNILIREDGEWKMVHHHASDMAGAPPEPEDDEDDADSGSGMLH